MSDMTALTNFLLARFAEDEAAAKAATAGPWRINSESDDRPGRDPYLTVVAIDEGVLDGGGEYCGDVWLAADEADLTHIVRWDPARVLAEVDAKRRIVEIHQSHVRAVGEGLSAPTRKTLQLLALPYADHPDYREEWKP